MRVPRTGEQALRIVGEIEFPPEHGGFSGATVNITVLDTRQADAPSTVLCKQVVRNIKRSRDSAEPLRFSVDCEDLPGSPFITVSVLVDVDGDGSISRGDYINMESCPAESFPREMRIRVREVK